MTTPREAIAEWFGGDEPYNHADSVILALRRSGWDITPSVQRHNPDESAVLFLALHCEGWTWTLDADDVADDVVDAINFAVGDDQQVTLDGIFVPQWMTTVGQARLLKAMRVDAPEETQPCRCHLDPDVYEPCAAVDCWWLRATADLDTDQTPTPNPLSSEAEIPKLMDALEVAWGIIANGRAWDDAMHDEWEAAKFRFRDEHWHPALDRNWVDAPGGLT